MARKQKMKVYHGIPKSVTDKHTIFYLKEDANILNNTTRKYNTPTGEGYTDFKGSDGIVANIDSIKQLTVDFWLDTTNYVIGSDSTVLTILSQKNDRIIIIDQPKADKGTLCFSGTTSANQYGNYRITTDNAQGLKHIRCTINNTTMTIYTNGRVTETRDVFIDWYTGPKKLLLFSSSNNTNSIVSSYNLKGSIISDLHVSNIDRGDYFPNLPEDFIEGKAVIKPRMGQQQIKSDSIYSQTNYVKIPTFNAQTSKFFCLNENKSNGYLKDNHEIFEVTSADTWAKGSSFKIKGLNGEIISGVVDDNTAICKVLKVVDTSNLLVDSVSKLSVGDRLRAIKVSNKVFSPNDDASYYDITHIDETNRIITLSRPNWTQDAIEKGYTLAVEVTPATSSPIVKTQDGAIVSGTWKGLGTNVAMFTLDTNANIQGKDLYVEYSLTMIHGNSDFPELPHTVERAWGENDVEMKPVKYITITDDFKGKTSGSNKECSHYCSFFANPNLTNPLSFTPDSYIDYGKLYYYDHDAKPLSNSSVSGNKGQLLIAFNLIEIVERKLGHSIPSVDKAQWLKDNIEECGCSCYCYGISPSGNNIYLTNYCYKETRWYTDYKTHTNNKLTLLQYNQINTQNDWIKKSISPTGFVYFLLFTDATNGTAACTIWLDYVRVSIRLKTDPNFTTLYCENINAREDKCNPVLIQKETKTVKRYLPSKETFVTECSYVSQPQSAGNINGDSSRTKLIEDPYIYVTTLGTGFVSPTQEFYRNCLSYVGDEYVKSILYNLDGSPLEVNLNNTLRFTRVTCTTSNGNNKYVLPSKYFEGEYICIKPFLTSKNNELVITLSLRHIKNGLNVYHTEREFTLTNRPLIK